MLLKRQRLRLNARLLRKRLRLRHNARLLRKKPRQRLSERLLRKLRQRQKRKPVQRLMSTAVCREHLVRVVMLEAVATPRDREIKAHQLETATLAV